jgi:ADP-heptose:LPS heptosyltransferase
MPKRQRWRPVKGTGNRVYDPVERALVAVADAPGRLLHALWPRAVPVVDPETVREILVLRLDRIGDVVMSMPALADLRAAFPVAQIRLVVGRWSEPVARRAPVDEVLVWSAAWVGRAHEGTRTLRQLLAFARELRGDRIDLGIDLQGDVRSSLLLRATGARIRVGYANTGGGYLLTHVVPLDESISFVEQNRRAVATVTGGVTGVPIDPLSDAERLKGPEILAAAGVPTNVRPLVGLHPSGGRRVKQWPLGRWAEVVRRLQEEFGATVVITGSTADRALATTIARAVPRPVFDLTGLLDLRQTLAVLATLDLFLSPDTGPMHMAIAVGTPSASVFGPSDAVRYFSGGSGLPGTRHEVVRRELWCAPCNLIRKPPEECRHGEAPECLRLVEADDVHAAAVRLLHAAGFAARTGLPPQEAAGTSG